MHYNTHRLHHSTHAFSNRSMREFLHICLMRVYGSMIYNIHLMPLILTLENKYNEKILLSSEIKGEIMSVYTRSEVICRIKRQLHDRSLNTLLRLFCYIMSF